MTRENLKIGFVRRGFSPSGGAEAYLRRLAHGVLAAGHEVMLFTTRAWPESEWPGKINRITASGPIEFADELERVNPRNYCHLLISLERVWCCDFFRAGDGVFPEAVLVVVHQVTLMPGLEKIFAMVDGDAVKPRAHRRFSAKFPELPIRLQEDIVRCVFSLRRVAEETQSQVENLAGVLLVNRAEFRRLPFRSARRWWKIGLHRRGS